MIAPCPFGVGFSNCLPIPVGSSETFHFSEQAQAANPGRATFDLRTSSPGMRVYSTSKLAGQSSAERAISSFSLEPEDVGGSQSDNWNNLVANQVVPGAMG